MMEEGFQLDSAKPDRKTIERNRRNHMKLLFSKLYSLLPRPTSPAAATSKELGGAPVLLDRLQEAVKYIKMMQWRLEKLMRQRKGQHSAAAAGEGSSSKELLRRLILHIDVQQMRSGLLVTLISDARCRRPVFYEAVRVVEEGGAEVVAANFSVAGDKAFHTIHTSDVDLRSGDEACKVVLERLKTTIQDLDKAG